VSIAGILPAILIFFDCQAALQPGGAVPPSILLSRPMDQVGSKSDTTLGIAGLHFEIGAFPGAAPDQFELPRGRPTPGTGNGVVGRTAIRQRVMDAVG
jgi:hypothetical protein